MPHSLSPVVHSSLHRRVTATFPTSLFAKVLLRELSELRADKKDAASRELRLQVDLRTPRTRIPPRAPALFA